MDASRFRQFLALVVALAVPLAGRHHRRHQRNLDSNLFFDDIQCLVRSFQSGNIVNGRISGILGVGEFGPDGRTMLPVYEETYRECRLTRNGDYLVPDEISIVQFTDTQVRVVASDYATVSGKPGSLTHPVS